MRDEWRERLKNLSTNQDAPHKPLLSLLILTQALSKGAVFPYGLVEQRVSEALRLVGNERADARYPFWHLRQDGFWEFEDLGEHEGRRKPPPMSWLRAHDARVPDRIWQALLEDKDLVHELIELILETYFEPAQRAPLRELFGVPPMVRGAASGEAAPPVLDLERAVETFARDLRASHITFGQGDRHERFVRTFMASLATKRFATIFTRSGDEDVVRALDRQVMQKLLPRLHGSRRRLEATLCALGRFCHDLTFEEGSILSGGALAFDPLSHTGGAELPASFDKVRRMTRTLRANQFASFTE